MRFTIDSWRKAHLSVAELIDAWRLIPRMMVAGYGWVVYTVIEWYMKLKPTIISGCPLELAEKCIYDAPSNQHAALVTAVIGFAAVIFAFYTNSGKKWNGFTNWNGVDKDENGN